jgi:hypothetical protein
MLSYIRADKDVNTFVSDLRDNEKHLRALMLKFYRERPGGFWLDDKTKEEIRQRLLKEGVWTESLKDAALDERDEERIAQAKQELEGSNELLDFLESATKNILLPFLSGGTVPDNVEIKQYRSIQDKRNEDEYKREREAIFHYSYGTLEAYVFQDSGYSPLKDSLKALRYRNALRYVTSEWLEDHPDSQAAKAVEMMGIEAPAEYHHSLLQEMWPSLLPALTGQLGKKT